MKQITIISGKGGTGKTSLTAAFAQLAADHPNGAVVADCDVDAADLHLILTPSGTTSKDFLSGYGLTLDKSRCTACGVCEAICRFHAVSRSSDGVQINPYRCEGCGACVDRCPAGALSLFEKKAGELYQSHTRFGPMVHARLGIAEATSGKLVTAVRKRAAEIAEKEGRAFVLVDGSPGIGCPVIASLTGVDAAVLVVEPTVSGRHDLERVLGLCLKMKVKAFLILNKFDLNTDQTEAIERSCGEKGVPVLARLPFDKRFVSAMVQKRTLLEEAPRAPAAKEIAEAWERLMKEGK